MKKTYLKPQCHLVALEPFRAIATSADHVIPTDDGTSIDTGDSGDVDRTDEGFWIGGKQHDGYYDAWEEDEEE